MDFIEEKTFLQWNGEKLGTIIDRAPKCLPELAGEGIEHCWVYSELFYRLLPLVSKKNKEKFNESARKSVSNSLLTIERFIKLGKMARNCIVAY